MIVLPLRSYRWTKTLFGFTSTMHQPPFPRPATEKASFTIVDYVLIVQRCKSAQCIFEDSLRERNRQILLD